MTLCFGVFATILKKATSDSVMNRELVSKLVGTIDPDHLYNDGNHDDAVSKLMSGVGNFPKSERSESFSAIRESSGSTTCIIPTENIRTFESCADMDFDSAVSSDSVIILPRFLAGVFLYVLSTNKNDRESVTAVKKDGFFESFLSALITYTDLSTPGYTAAPDDCVTYLERLRQKYVRTVFEGADR